MVMVTAKAATRRIYVFKSYLAMSTAVGWCYQTMSLWFATAKSASAPTIHSAM